LCPIPKIPKKRTGEDVNKWKSAIENALVLEADEVNHTPEWAEEIIINIREIGNRK